MGIKALAIKKQGIPKSITEELELIRVMNDGFLDPIKVEDYAQNPSTLLHNKFEWDDTEAAYQFRLEQARRIIRLELILLPLPDGTKSGKEVRAFISLIVDRKADGNRGYRTLLDVMSDPDLRAQALEVAYRDMIIFLRKHRYLSELSKVFKAMDELIN